MLCSDPDGSEYACRPCFIEESRIIGPTNCYQVLVILQSQEIFNKQGLECCCLAVTVSLLSFALLAAAIEGVAGIKVYDKTIRLYLLYSSLFVSIYSLKTLAALSGEQHFV
uniref:Uncharacterized protein n=1 Tax=Amphimedon queenslandica TaxID=400682 RepID=A0A1X7T782_AMPQE